MLFLSSATYDASSQILTVRLRSASGTSWAAYEYRSVQPDTYQRLRAAQPHGALVLGTDVAPFHEVRRVGQSAWQPPKPSPARGEVVFA